MERMKDKVVVITGAVRGIGYGVALAFAAEGAKLAITDISEADLAVAKAKIKEKYDVEVLTVVADGRDEEAVKRGVSNIVEKYGAIDVLINNAQAAKVDISILEHTKEDFDLAFQSGVYAAFYYMKACFPYLKEAKGSVINFASASGFSGRPREAAYGAGKEAIRCLTRVAANEWGPYGINVNNVCPLASTPALEAWKENAPEMFAKTIQNIPLQRFGDPVKDIAPVCVFLASEEGNYITGETIAPQGGVSLRP